MNPERCLAEFAGGDNHMKSETDSARLDARLVEPRGGCTQQSLIA
jgi:hypothetical protein